MAGKCILIMFIIFLSTVALKIHTSPLTYSKQNLFLLILTLFMIITYSLFMLICKYQLDFLIVSENNFIPSYTNWPTANVKMYQCNTCSRSYQYSHNLKRHQLFECGKAPSFQCPHCQYKAKQKASLKLHLKRMHNYVDKTQSILTNQSTCLYDN